MATLNPIQQLQSELPSLEYVISMIERALSLPKQDEITKLIESEGRAAEKILRKELRFIVEGQLSAAEGPNVLDVKALKAKVTYDGQTFARILTSNGEGDRVKELRKKNPDPVSFGEALVNLAKNSKDDTVKTLRKGLAEGLDLVQEVGDRVKKGGHPAVDLKISRLAQQSWQHTDVCTNLLRAACIKNGIAYDPVLANAPDHVKSPFRLALSNLPPGAHKPSKPRKAASAPKKDEKAGGSGAGEGAGAHPPAPKS